MITSNGASSRSSTPLSAMSPASTRSLVAAPPPRPVSPPPAPTAASSAGSGSAGSHTGIRLESWKEIAVVLGRRVRTVQRWERDEGLPVHRHRHAAGTSVYAYRDEVLRWLASRCEGPRGLEDESASELITPSLAGPNVTGAADTDCPSPVVAPSVSVSSADGPSAQNHEHGVGATSIGQHPEARPLDSRWRRFSHLAFAAAAALAVAGSALVGLVSWRGGGGLEPAANLAGPLVRVAFEPVAVLGDDPGLLRFATGLAEEVVVALAAQRPLAVLVPTAGPLAAAIGSAALPTRQVVAGQGSTESGVALPASFVPPSPRAGASDGAVGREMRADRSPAPVGSVAVAASRIGELPATAAASAPSDLVFAAAVRAGDRGPRVTARLMRPEDGEVLWAGSFEAAPLLASDRDPRGDLELARVLAHEVASEATARAEELREVIISRPAPRAGSDRPLALDAQVGDVTTYR